MIGTYKNSTKFHTAVKTCIIFIQPFPQLIFSGEDILTAPHTRLHPSTPEQSFCPGLSSGRCGRRTVEPNLVVSVGAAECQCRSDGMKIAADAERTAGSATAHCSSSSSVSGPRCRAQRRKRFLHT